MTGKRSGNLGEGERLWPQGERLAQMVSTMGLGVFDAYTFL